MNNLKKLISFFTIKPTTRNTRKAGSAPLLIIKKDTSDSNIKEYQSIEEAIADLENDPNVPSYKIEKLKSSLKNLKNKTSIKIQNRGIIK